MKTVFHWGNVNFEQTRKLSYQEKFDDDFKTLFKTDPKEAHVYFETYQPAMLSGFVNDESGKKLCGFRCDLLSNKTISYDFG